MQGRILSPRQLWKCKQRLSQNLYLLQCVIMYSFSLYPWDFKLVQMSFPCLYWQCTIYKELLYNHQNYFCCWNIIQFWLINLLEKKALLCSDIKGLWMLCYGISLVNTHFYSSIAKMLRPLFFFEDHPFVLLPLAKQAIKPCC